MFGFGFNKEKCRANAEKYLQQNKLPRAIAEFEKILKVEPHDFTVLNTVGDIYSRLGQNDKAVEHFQIVGDAYANEGFNLKAIAVFKKITKLAPHGFAAMEKLAELYRKQGLVNDARATLLHTADAYGRKGLQKESLRLLRQLVLIDPENVPVINRTAELLAQTGQQEEAKDLLWQTASTLVAREALEPARQLLERLAFDKDNPRVQGLYAQVLLQLGDTEKAVKLYETIADLDASPEGLRHLLTAYLQLGRLKDALPIARSLIVQHQDASGVAQLAARLYKENETLPALDLYNEFAEALLTLDKEDVLAHLRGAVGRLRTNPTALATLLDLFRRAGDNSVLGEILELQAHAWVQLNQFEAARDAYKALIELEPGNATHLQGYRQVCARLNPDGAEATPEEATPSSKGPHTLEEFLADKEPALPTQNYAPEIAAQLTAALDEAELRESYSSPTRGIEALENALQLAPDDLRLNLTLARLSLQQGDTARATRCFATMQRVLEELGYAEAAAFYGKRVTAQQTVAWETTPQEFAPSNPSTADNGSAEEIDLSEEWEAIWKEPPAAAETTAARTALSPEASEVFEELHFCIEQQIWEEASSALERFTQLCPNHPELPQLTAEVRQHYAAKPPALEVIDVSTQPTAEPSLASLVAELDVELGEGFVSVDHPPQLPTAKPPQPLAAQPTMAAPEIPAAPDLEPSIFSELLQDFEQELTAPEEEDGDPETHFNLGIAFREMGLLDEAIGELQKVCRLASTALPTDRALQAYIWLATCLVEKSVPEAALPWFHRALQAAPDDNTRVAVNYALADAYEAAGRRQEALEHFLQVYGSNIDYRDVAARIQQLRAQK